MRDSARVVVRELIRQPVKEAVRDALTEQAAVVREADESAMDVAAMTEADRERDRREAEAESGRSRGFWLGAFLAIAGVAYLARRRSSGGSMGEAPSPGSVAQQEGQTGYDSEGEMQTAETADENTSATDETGPTAE